MSAPIEASLAPHLHCSSRVLRTLVTLALSHEDFAVVTRAEHAGEKPAETIRVLMHRVRFDTDARTRLVAILSEHLGAEARRFEDRPAAEVGAAWHRARARGKGPVAESLLWATARRPACVFRLLEERIVDDLELSAFRSFAAERSRSCMMAAMRGRLVCLPLLALLLGCSSNDSEEPPPTEELHGPKEWNRSVTPPSDEEAADKRAACGYALGSLPAETQGESHPSGKEIPIDHVIVMMMENRSFDHYFQKLPEYGQPDVDVAPESFTNPDPGGGAPIAPFHGTQYCFVDTNHGWAGAHQQVGAGKMDGFTASNEGWHELPAHGTLEMQSGKRAMAYYDETDLPFYYWLASEFSIADRYFCSLQGPTWPNRMFLYAATSFGLTSNTFPDTAGSDVLADNLEQRQLDWKVYGEGLAGYSLLPDKFIPYVAEHRKTLEDFYADAAAGKLPAVAFVDPDIGSEGYKQNDEHPPAMAPIGERFVATVVDALAKSPNWGRSAMFLTYDEHGGLYDHVVPPPACPPDDRPVQLDKQDPVARFDQLGIRVPMMVVSPWAKKHFVAHHVYDHTSIVRFIEARFVMPALSARDANAEAPWEMFDFAAPPHATAPAVAIPEVDQAKVDACAAVFEP